MTVYQLDQSHLFPDPREADPTGLLAIGGDLHPERLLRAYASGIFPWPLDEEMPLTWFSPDPRMVLVPSQVRISRSLRRDIRRRKLDLSADSAFDEVVEACAETRESTWITEDMHAAYARLHELGFAHSIEVREDDELIGGLYGVSIGGVFCGESMFHRRDNASKIAFCALAAQCFLWDFDMIDCQLPTEHLASLGARPQTRESFLSQLADTIHKRTRRGKWSIEREVRELLLTPTEAWERT